jgi:hypothetical protein
MFFRHSRKSMRLRDADMTSGIKAIKTSIVSG